MKRKTLERLKAALAADVSANKALGMQTDKDSPPSKKRKMSPEPLPGPSRLANTDIEEIVGKNGKAKDPKKPGKELKRPSEAEALSPKRRKKTEGEEHLAIKPSELEKDADLIDFDIKSFRKDVVVLNNDQIKIILKKVAFKKQNKFKYSDHLFEVAFLPKKNGKAPLLLDLLDFFRLVIVKIVLMLRKYYHKALSDSGKKNIMKVHRQIYGTITSDHMVRGMNSANYSIQTQPELIAFQLTNALFRFLQSYEELRLDRQFGIYFKVLSTSHANFRAWKKHNLDLHIPVGAKVVGFKADPESRAGWKFVAPEGYPQQEKAFSGRCLLISVIIGVLYNGWLQNPISDCGRKWEIVRNIHSKDLEQKNSAGRLLQNEMNTLLAHSNLSAYSKKDYIEDTLPVLSKYFNVQITVHSERANNRITCVFPPKFMHNMCQIHLYQTMNYGDSVDHVDFILNRRTLIQKHGMVHNCCYVFSHGPQVGHLCRSQESCLCCRRQILKLDSYVNEEIKEITCNSNTFPGVFEKCKICGLMKKSYDCGQYHDKYCCQKGFLCGNCNKYISISSRWKTVEAIKVGHKCLTKLCKTCFEYYPVEEDHSCLLRPVQLQKYHHNLGMIDFEYLAQKIDPNTFELVPVQASILFEDGEKETFTEKQFLDEKFGHSEPADRQIVMPYMMELDHMSTMSKKLAACERVGRFSKPFSKKSKKSILEKCQTKVTSNVTERLVNFIVTRKFQSYTFIVWSENQLKTIMKQLIVMTVTPKVLHSQSKYHLVTIPQFDITFVSRESYVVGTLEELRSTYATKVPIQFYPRDFLTEETMTYVGERPSCELFLRSEHSNKEQNEIKKWYHDQEHKKTWSLANELVTFCSYKMRIFSATLMAFLSYAFKLQSEMWKFFPATSGTEGVPLFSPFSYPITSVGALSFTLYRYFGLRSQLCAVNYETGRPNFKSSQGELELVSFLTELVSPSEVNTSFSIHDQKSFQHIRPDFYCEEKKYAACFQGCQFHGCIRKKCTVLQNPTRDSINCFGRQHGELQDEWNKKMERFMLQYGPNGQDLVHEFMVIFECEWKERKQTDQLVIDFMLNRFSKRPLNRLIPRKAVRGGKVSVMGLKWSKKDSPNTEFLCQDISSHYPSIMRENNFPIGHPFTILGKDCKKLIVINEKLYYKGGEVGGLLQLTILCPTDLQYPFFPHESSKNINVYGCCKTCIKERRQTRCPKRHSVDERSLSLVVTVPEYIYSLSLGYELVEMHEALLYRNKAAIFKDFMSFLAREKIRFSKVPSSETAASYAEKINQSLGLTGSWQLKESSFSYNVQMRTFCKTFLNVIAGKFIQSEDGFQTILVHSQVELEKLFWEKKIQSLEMATPDVMQVVIKTTSKKANRSRNVVIGAYILGLSKIKMSEAIKRVEKSGGTPMYSDTDSLYWIHPLNKKNVLDVGEMFGCWHSEIPDNEEVLNFICLGSKSYALLIKNRETGKITSLVKCKGFTLNSVENEKKVDYSLYSSYLNDFFNDITQKNVLAQYRRKPIQNLGEELRTHYTKVVFSNAISIKGVINRRSQNYLIKPFGHV